MPEKSVEIPKSALRTAPFSHLSFMNKKFQVVGKNPSTSGSLNNRKVAFVRRDRLKLWLCLTCIQKNKEV